MLSCNGGNKTPRASYYLDRLHTQLSLARPCHYGSFCCLKNLFCPFKHPPSVTSHSGRSIVDPNTCHHQAQRPYHFNSTSGSFVSTLDPQGKPRDFYRYLGVYLYTENQLSRVIEFISAEIRAYFNTLSLLGLTHTELIRLTNCQLVPILMYGLMA